MRGIRFYLEYPNKTEKNKATRKKLGNHDGNVVAIFSENKWLDKDRGLMYDSVSALLFKQNSPVCGCSVPADYLDEYCKRISEKQAREIHPALFEILDETE